MSSHAKIHVMTLFNLALGIVLSTFLMIGGFLLIYPLFTSSCPLFKLDERNAVYQIHELENTNYIVKIKQNSSSNTGLFKGDAMKIESTDVQLHQYLDQNVEVHGYLLRKSGACSYHIFSVKRLSK